MTTKGDLVKELFQKLQYAGDDPYLYLIQHSSSFSVRQSAVSVAVDEHVYLRARVRTPTENAARDWMGGELWLRHIVMQCTSGRPVVYIQTVPSRLGPSCIDQPNVTRLDVCSSDPFRWTGERSNKPSIEDLESILSAVTSASKNQTHGGPVVIILESIVPLARIHAWPNLIIFLQKLNVLAHPLLVLVRTECFNAKQHGILEDMAQAVLLLKDGDATLVRQGVRERSNIIREKLHFNIVEDADGQRNIKFTEDEPEDEPEEETAEDMTETFVGRAESGVGSRRKMKLRIEPSDGSTYASEGHQTDQTNQGLQIYVQDDDPEFEDYDGEDPDDDLDV